jgi:hypothetical protein
MFAIDPGVTDILTEVTFNGTRAVESVAVGRGEAVPP